MGTEYIFWVYASEAAPQTVGQPAGLPVGRPLAGGKN
jgi:hypothetical protein